MFLLTPGLFAKALLAACVMDRTSTLAIGGYSFRRLRRVYTGPAVRVRRDSDNATADIGFVGDDLDTAALLAFVGSGTGYLVTWYGQSAGAQHATQLNPALQPVIVSAGVLVRLNNATARPAVRFDLARYTHLLRSGFIVNSSVFAASSVASGTASTRNYSRLLSYADQGQSVDYNSSASAILFLNDGDTLKNFQNGFKSGAPISRAPFQATSLFDGSAATVTVDGVAGSPTGSSGYLSNGTLSIGNDVANQNNQDPWDGIMCEHIIFAGAYSAADQATIRADQRTYYGTP